MAMRTGGLLRVVSVAALLSAVAILHPPDPCFALFTFAGNSCTTTALTWLSLLLGGAAAVIGLVGLVVSSPALPVAPIFGSRLVLLVSVTFRVSVAVIVSGLVIVFPADPCAGLRAQFASSCTIGHSTDDLLALHRPWAHPSPSNQHSLILCAPTAGGIGPQQSACGPKRCVCQRQQAGVSSEQEE
jgi:hypothetical protein